MQSAIEYMKTKGLDLESRESIPFEDFDAAGLPAVVACANCTMTMALPSAWLDEGLNCYCADCAGVFEDDD